MSAPRQLYEDAAAILNDGASALDESARHWQAVIACLPTAAKREAAWAFYLHRFANAGSAADLLSGFVFMLEAHSLFLEQLPERRHDHFITPFKTQQRALHEAIAGFQQRQGEARAAIEKVSVRNLRAEARALINVHTVRKRLREAATAVDAQALVDGVKKQLEEKALAPLNDALAALAEKTGACEQTATAAQKSIEGWRRVHLGGIVGCIAALALLLAGAAAFWTWYLEEAHFARRLAGALAQVESNQEALTRLAALEASLQIVPLPNANGSSVSNRFALYLEGAVEAGMEDHDGRRRGYVISKVGALAWRLEELERQLSEFEKDAGVAPALRSGQRSEGKAKR